MSRDDGVGLSLGDQIENLALPFSQLREDRTAGGANLAAEEIPDPSGHRRAEDRVALGDSLDRTQESSRLLEPLRR